MMNTSSSVQVPTGNLSARTRCEGQWVTEYKRQEKKMRLLDKDCETMLFNNRVSLYDELIPLSNFAKQLGTDREKDELQLLNRVSKLKVLVQHLTSYIENGVEEADYFPNLSKLIKTLETQFLNFKTRQKQMYNELMSEENKLTNALALFNTRMNSWEHENTDHRMNKANPTITSGVKVNYGSKSSSRIKQEPAALTRVQAQIDCEGGPTGGWTENDHADFLRIRAQVVDQSTVIERCISLLPHINQEDIEKHCNWYTRYLQYIETKKSIIHEWRVSKEQEKKIEAEKKYLQERQQASEQQKRQNELREKETILKKEQITKWRKQQDEAKSKQAWQEAQKKEEIERQNRLRIQASKQRREMKVVLNAHNKALKEAEIAEETEERKRSARTHPRQLELLRQKNARLMQQILVKKKQHEAKQIARENRIQNLIIESTPAIISEVSSDRRRLTAQTEAQKRRQTHAEKEREERKKLGKAPNTVFLGQSSSRAVPSWRQGL